MEGSADEMVVSRFFAAVSRNFRKIVCGFRDE